MTLAEVGGRLLAIFGAGERVYAVDAATGARSGSSWPAPAAATRWQASPPGCAASAASATRSSRRRSSRAAPSTSAWTSTTSPPARAASTPSMPTTAGWSWFFDLQSGAVCRPDPADDIRRYDGYHSETELGLPAGFFTTRSGCDHPRSRNGCGNVWSSPALDAERRLLYFGTSNCDTDDDPATRQPAPPMPPYDEALVALRLDGTPAWRWRPSEVDPDDLAFGAAPNLFRSTSAAVGSSDVVGIGNKDGTYYVLDREGTNVRDRRGLGRRGAIPAVLADQGRARRRHRWRDPDRVDRPAGPQGPLLDRAGAGRRSPRSGRRSTRSTSTPARCSGRTGRPTSLGGDASYGPTSGVPGVAIVGSVITPHLRLFDTTDRFCCSTATSATRAGSPASRRAPRSSTARWWWAPASGRAPAPAPVPATSPPTRRPRSWPCASRAHRAVTCHWSAREMPRWSRAMRARPRSTSPSPCRVLTGKPSLWRGRRKRSRLAPATSWPHREPSHWRRPRPKRRSHLQSRRHARRARRTLQRQARSGDERDRRTGPAGEAS